MTKLPCIHLEALLPRPKKPLPMYATDTIDKYPDTNEKYDPKATEDKFIRSLRAYGINQSEWEVILSRYIGGLSWEEIVIEQHFTSRGAAEYLCRRILKYLRRSKFQFVKEKVCAKKK